MSWPILDRPFSSLVAWWPRCMAGTSVSWHEMGERCSCYIGVIAELHGGCSHAPGAATCLSINTHISLRGVSCQCTLSQVMVLRALLVTLWSNWLQPRLCPPATLICWWHLQPKATEYLLKTAADHVLNTLLLGLRMRVPLPQERLACGSCSSTSVVWEPSARPSLNRYLLVTLETGSVFFFLLLCCVFWCQRSDPGKVLPSLKTYRFTVKFLTFRLRPRRQLVRPRPIATRIVLIWRVSAFSSRVRIGMTLTVACPWD